MVLRIHKLVFCEHCGQELARRERSYVRGRGACDTTGRSNHNNSPPAPCLKGAACWAKEREVLMRMVLTVTSSSRWWAIIIYLALMAVVFIVFVAEEVLSGIDFNPFPRRPLATSENPLVFAQPYYGDSVPSWVLKGVIGPTSALIVMVVQYTVVERVHGVSATWERVRHTVAAGMAVYWSSFAASGVSGMLKLLFPYPRPYFYLLCFGDDYSPSRNGAVRSLSDCTSGVDPHVLAKAAQAFPSGHSAQVTVFMLCLALQVWHAMRLVEMRNLSSTSLSAQKPSASTQLICSTISTLTVVVSMTVLLGVAGSRVVDHAHFFSNVVWGVVIGFGAVLFCFCPCLVFLNQRCVEQGLRDEAV